MDQKNLRHPQQNGRPQPGQNPGWNHGLNGAKAAALS